MRNSQHHPPLNSIALHFLDGTAFFTGLALVLLAGAGFLRFGSGFARPVWTLLALAGIATVLLSAAPLPGWAYALWSLSAFTVLLLGNGPNVSPVLRLRAFVLLLGLTTGLLLAEVPRHRTPRIRVPADRSIHVIGDSISSGIGTGERPWPEVLAAALSRPIANHAEPGATAQRARAQVDAIAQPNAFVLLEIGGNDLLHRQPPAAFEQQLDELLAALKANGHDTLMLELPLFPFQAAYGRAQRAAARRHGARLLPKRHFARALGLPGGTLDGLHLSQAGHDELARRIARALLTP